MLVVSGGDVRAAPRSHARPNGSDPLSAAAERPTHAPCQAASGVDPWPIRRRAVLHDRGSQSTGVRRDLLSPALLNHSCRAFVWGSAIAAQQGIQFDRELLYVASMFHDTGLPSPVPHVDFTVRSAELAREFTARHGVPADGGELVANAIALHHTPGVGLELGAEAFLLSAGAGVDVFGLRSDKVTDAVRRNVIREFPRLGFKREFSGLWRAEARQVPRGRAWLLHRFAMTDLSIRLAPFRD